MQQLPQKKRDGPFHGRPRVLAWHVARRSLEANVGMFFHAYGHNSVNALHLHILDMDATGEPQPQPEPKPSQWQPR